MPDRGRLRGAGVEFLADLPYPARPLLEDRARAIETDVTTSSASPTVKLSRRAIAAGGQPISYLMQKALAQPELISLAAGFVDQQSLPIQAVDGAWRNLAADESVAHAALQYGTTAGYRPLREALLADQVAADGNAAPWHSVTPEQVVVTSGSNQLLHLLVDTLCDPGDVILCAAPTYFVFLGMLKNLGVRGVSIATDEEGIVPEALEEQLGRYAAGGELARVKAIYVVSYFDNPRSVTMSAARRRAVVELAERYSTDHKIYVLEDAAYRELRFFGDDIPSIASYENSACETVIVTQTFSKSFSPGVRIGWGLLPRELVEPICDQKSNIDFGAPNLNQHLIYEAHRVGETRRQASRLREVYRAKRDAMVAACDKYLAPISGVSYRRPTGGLYVWLTLPPGMDAGTESPLFNAALAAGVIYVPGEYSFACEGEPIVANTVRLSFGVQSPERIAVGIRLLSEAVRQVADASTSLRTTG